MNVPEVSVVLPTFNRLPWLREAVASVLAQTHRDWELIVADDGSDAPTREWLGGLAADPRVTLLWLAHSGNPGTARNAALREARGKYVAFLDSDDRWLPHRLATQVGAMRAADCRWSYCAFARIGADGGQIVERQRWWNGLSGALFAPLLTFAAVVPTPAVIVERVALQEFDGFDTRLVQFEDYHLWLRLSLVSEVLLVDECLVEVRSHDAHYFSAGLVALERWRRMLELLRAEPLEARQRALLEQAHRRNTLQLARGYGARGETGAAVAMLADGARTHAGPAWWLAVTAPRVYLSAPPWLRQGIQSLRARARGRSRA
jgi:glycosyltransferase involved in cell wall biosynthesis